MDETYRHAQLRPDEYLGRVDLRSGMVYLGRAASKEPLRKVKTIGHCHVIRGKSHGSCAGKVKKMTSLAREGPFFYR